MSYVAYLNGEQKILAVARRLDSVSFGPLIAEITAGQYAQVDDNIFHPGATALRWQLVGGTLSETPDNRPRVRVEGRVNASPWGYVAKFQGEVGQTIDLRFSVIDENGDVVTAVSGDFFIELPTTPKQFVKLTMTDGISQALTLDTTRAGQVIIGSSAAFFVPEPMEVAVYQATTIFTEPLE